MLERCFVICGMCISIICSILLCHCLVSLSTEIEKAVKDAKDEIMGMMQAESDILEMKSEAKALCEAEILETYNRRDNVKIFGFDSCLWA